MVPKHPDQYTDEELETWVRHLVDDQVSEGPRLDYKETISLKGEKQRLEAAKDISSFANEIGGTILYGIPEDRQSDEIAIPCKPYGIDPVPDLQSRLENIYTDSISPRLPEFCIRKVELTEYNGKAVYIVWTPESWLGPHMVQAHQERRYYRRGQLRAVVMNEHEVRQRYERLRILQSATDEFLASPQLKYLGSFLPEDQFISHYVVCPEMLLYERVDFNTEDMRNWLDRNHYTSGGTGYQWLPSQYGVRASPAEGYPLKAEVHRNGAISYWSRASVRQEGVGRCKFLYKSELPSIMDFLKFARYFYEKIQHFAPLRFRIGIENRTDETLWLPHQGPGSELPLITHDRSLLIDFIEPSSKLFENPNLILKQIADEMFRAFGLWEADCFDEQLNLRR